MFGKILLSTLLLSFLRNSYSEDICNKHLHFLANKQQLFLFCATVHAVPVELCMGCEEPYEEMNKAYQDLKDEVNCTAKYFDKDRINIVQTTQTILVGLWTKAFCDDCFNGNNSLIFDEKQQLFYDCISTHKKHECVACLVKYDDLNNFYSDLDDKHEGQICYDMQDKMNRTRALWSDTYDCCKRVVDLNLFTVAVSIVLFLPIIFYGSVFAWAKRDERNYVLLNTDTEASTSTAAVTSNSIENIEPSSSRHLTTEANNTYSVRMNVAAENSSDESLKVSKLAEDSSDSDDSIYDTKKLT